MKKALTSGLAGAAALAGAAFAEPADRAAVEKVLSTYETALNAKDVETIIALYADDGVFMPQHSSPQVGRAAVREAYRRVFAAITLDIEFHVDEIEPLSATWAFARTRSEGQVTVNATGQSAGEANQELFLFRRTDDGKWKIARYIFSTTNPPRQ